MKKKKVKALCLCGKHPLKVIKKLGGIMVCPDVPPGTMYMLNPKFLKYYPGTWKEKK